jgi:hypothetical protein
LAEGVDTAALGHFQSLQFPDGTWAITDSFTGIHCVPLKTPDWHVMVSHGANAVWSPMSNLLLYGGTADIAAARAEGVRVGLGSDWSPSGSKNLFGELKAARTYGQTSHITLNDRDLLAMATTEAATILRWDKRLGSLEPGKLADLLVVDGVGDDPYSHLFTAAESSITLVMIAGAPRFGAPTLMQALSARGETVTIGGKARTFDATPSTEDPAVASISLAEATSRLRDALAHLPHLAQAPDRVNDAPRVSAGTTADQHWHLALDELSDTGVDLRPAFAGTLSARPLTAGPPLPLKPLSLDSLTVADDETFFDRLQAEQNLPKGFVAALRSLY